MNRSQASYLVWATLCAVFAVALLVVAFETAMHFNGYAIDGPFQLYNALRRIQAGFRPGVDFQFFHGLGLPYIHYPIYRVLGGGLRGSELARELVSAAVYPTVLLAFFRVFSGDWRRTFCLTAAALSLSFLLRLSAVMFALNSMLGVRSALPTLFPAVLYLSRTGRTRAIAGGVALGAALFVSTEQGLAVALAYAAVSVLAVVRRDTRWRQFIEFTGTLAIAGLTLVMCLIVVGGWAGMLGALGYNFVVVPKDQYWYFGAPPNLFVPSWTRGAALAIIIWPIGLALLLGSVATVRYAHRFWRNPNGDRSRRHFALAILPIYGLLSCASLLGVFEPSYAQPCWRVIILIGLLELIEMPERSAPRTGSTYWLGVPRAVAVTSLVVSLWSIATIRLIPRAVIIGLPHILRDHLVRGVGFSIDGMWPQALADAQRTVDGHRGPHGEPPALWSTYAGWIEARNGLFHPSFDYIIHALGPDNRRAYVAKFRAIKPPLAQTVLPTYTQYEPWIENTAWEFYDELLRSYTVTSITPWSIFWQRRSRPGPEPELLATMNVPAGLDAVTLPPLRAADTNQVVLLEIDVKYETRNPLHWLPIVGQSPRYLIGIDGALSQLPISLDPFVRHTRFPLIVRPGKPAVLYFRTLSLLPGASWAPRALSVYVRPVDSPNRAWLTNLVARITRQKR